ncbi:MULTISPECIES: hypothetical protein [Streptomyces]|uniref:Uncharacterized protein n=2 Tax=Streptomyces TaxID=1883 RepID=A0ABS9JKW3_9ACTN|nr:hypothetical protein [Streptomyces tricolor]MCG0066188.1 hypothetical protein [Streptomyces tricolor]MYU29270.1 hypothetical protein [Streptomyces sp. SID7810]CUW30321.1 hypothetical protein TUE45_05048 [Streptomyces reticuli]
MTTDVQTKKDAYKRGEEQGRADALAGKPYADPPRDGARGEKDHYANGYDWGYEQGRAQNEQGQDQKLDLVVWQEGGVEDAPGGLGTTINVCVRTPNWSETVDAGEREHVFTAPTGFRWNGTVGAQYKRMNQTTGGNLPPVQAKVSDDGRTLTFTYHVHLNTSDQDKDCIVYTCGLEAVDGAPLGRHTDGVAQVGTAPPAKLKAEVIEDED